MMAQSTIPNRSRDDILALDDDKLLGLCRADYYRGTGPGGQHRNTTDSAVRLTLAHSSISAECSAHRSQHRNKTDALRRLRLNIAFSMRMPATSLWSGHWNISKKHRDYPVFIAIFIDALNDSGWKVGAAAKSLGISTGKLNRALSADTRAWKFVNDRRRQCGLNILKK